MEKIKIIIADDLKILREGIRALLVLAPDIEVIGTAINGLEAFKKAEVLKPDIVLMDMRMPEYDGIYGTKMIKTAFPDIKVMVLTTFDDPQSVNQAVKAGADGYVLKESSSTEIINAIRNVAANMNVFDNKIFENIRTGIVNDEQNDAIEDSVNITDREREIIKLVVDGMSNKEIAAKLFISDGTVRNTISFLLEKLGVNDRTQLAVYAVKHNLDR